MRLYILTLIILLTPAIAFLSGCGDTDTMATVGRFGICFILAIAIAAYSAKKTDTTYCLSAYYGTWALLTLLINWAFVSSAIIAALCVIVYLCEEKGLVKKILDKLTNDV